MSLQLCLLCCYFIMQSLFKVYSIKFTGYLHLTYVFSNYCSGYGIFPIQDSQIQSFWEAPRSIHLFILRRVIRFVPGTLGDLKLHHTLVIWYLMHLIIDVIIVWPLILKRILIKSNIFTFGVWVTVKQPFFLIYTFKIKSNWKHF